LREMGENFCRAVGGKFRDEKKLKRCSKWFIRRWKKAVSNDGEEEREDND